MTRFFYRIAGITAMAFLLSGCVTQDRKTEKLDDIIFVSIEPQQFLVEQIAGEAFQVKSLLPPGASPATFEPEPSHLKDLANAKAYLKIGHIGFENAWMDRISNTNKKMKVYDQSNGVEFIKSDHVHHHDGHGHVHSSVDPHIWLSPSQLYIQIANIKNMLNELMPDSANYFEQNHEKLKVLITNTDKAVMRLFETVDKKTFMIYHPSLSYFAGEYGLTQLPLEYEGKEPSGKYMTELIQKSQKLKINTVFIQKQFPDSKAKAIARELNAKVVKIDPLAYNLPENLLAMAKEIQKSLTN
jgi:zinc transport system substrate-binding protein